MDPTNADIIREIIECLKDTDPNSSIPEEFETRLKKSAIEKVSDSREFRLLAMAALFELRNSQRALNSRLNEMENNLSVIDGRTKERLKAMRGLM